MDDTKETPLWQPTTEAERCTALDAMRGLALLGVLLVNLHSNFRVSLAEDLLGPPPSHRLADRVADRLVVVLLQFKAFALFTLLFGAGLAVFGERAAARAASPTRFLARRLLILLALGLGHLLLVWNGDILTLYAVCGLLMLPLRRLPAAALTAVGEDRRGSDQGHDPRRKASDDQVEKECDYLRLSQWLNTIVRHRDRLPGVSDVASNLDKHRSRFARGRFFATKTS